MDIDLTIRYSDDRLCEVFVCRPGDDSRSIGLSAIALT
jgi:hypothetical protein